MKMKATLGLCAGILVAAALAGVDCTDSSGNGTPGVAGSSAAGSGGGSAGSGGTSAAGGAGGGGGTPGFMAIAPCLNESDYVTGTTVDFGVNGAATYEPKCLKITIPMGSLGTAGVPGTNVTFSGDFFVHPLAPSEMRGAQTGNPITLTSSLPDGGTSKAFYFSTPGFFAYYCVEHGASDTGAGMAGVVWAVSQ
jgi:hypothetical protein